jgi:hypothetical protein
MGTSNYQVKYNLLRDGTPIFQGTGEGGRPTSTGMANPYASYGSDMGYQVTFLGGCYLDSPATASSMIYKIQAASYNGQTAFINRSSTWQNSAANGYDSTPTSFLTILEVAG